MKNVLSFLIALFLFLPLSSAAEEPGFVALVSMDMMILPGTAEYLEKSIESAEAGGARVVIVRLNTPGGLLNTTQEMIQSIFRSDIPVIVYVGPSGATATSAGVFLTLAGHIAAMAPGTTIGAAHPVSGEGKDIEGDMRDKVENITVAMVKSISEERGRNAAWAEKAVKKSSSLTEKEALKENVIDLVADDYQSLLKKIAGKKIKIHNKEIVLEDYSALPQRHYDISFKQKTINTLSNPNVLALLWLAATTGISIELYNPGLILPGVVGAICLILAMAMSQIIPVTQGGVLLLILGAVLIASELFITSGVLGIGGIIAMIFGTIYLIDVVEAPGMSVNLSLIIPLVLAVGSLMLFLVYSIVSSRKRRAVTGEEGLNGQVAEAMATFTSSGKVFVNGEIWSAKLKEGIAEKGEKLRVVDVLDGLTLLVEKL